MALVLADLRLSGTLSGLDLARIVAARRPKTRAILTSAAEFDPGVALPAGVPKPWTCAELLAEAQRAIGSA